MCCNRAPEVLLSEAAPLADVFVFRLMFRLYRFTDRLGDDPAFGRGAEADGAALFYGRKRLLNSFAARRYPRKMQRDGKIVRCTDYLMISALALDTSPGACGALLDSQCSIHPRRPLSCRSVPIHYSRSDAAAVRAFSAFVATAGYRCDSGDGAAPLIENGRVIAPEIAAARAQAIETAERERPWSEAIVRQMNGRSTRCAQLPSLSEVEAAAGHGVVTVAMGAGWQIAVEAGLLAAEEADRLLRLQLDAIERALAAGRCGRDGEETLLEMQSDYRRRLRERPAASTR